MAWWTTWKMLFSQVRLSELINDFYGRHQKKNELEDAYADDL